MKQLIINEIDSARIIQRIKMGNVGTQKSNTKALLDELNKGQLMPPQKIPANVVTMHSIVRIKFLDNGKSFTMQLVYPEEANLKESKISIFAPTATALLGYQKGDIVEWQVPGGVAKILIDEIIYQPEAAGHFNL